MYISLCLSLSVSLNRGRAHLDSSERELLREVRQLRQKLAARARDGSSASSQSVHILPSVSQWPHHRCHSVTKASSLLKRAGKTEATTYGLAPDCLSTLPHFLHLKLQLITVNYMSSSRPTARAESDESFEVSAVLASCEVHICSVWISSVRSLFIAWVSSLIISLQPLHLSFCYQTTFHLFFSSICV